MNRRGFLKGAAVSTVAMMVPAPALGNVPWATIVSGYDTRNDWWWVRASVALSDGREWHDLLYITRQAAPTEHDALQIAGRRFKELLAKTERDKKQ